MKRLSFIHGFQDGILGLSVAQSKDDAYLEGFKLGKESLEELRIAAKEKYPL